MKVRNTEVPKQVSRVFLLAQALIEFEISHAAVGLSEERSP